MKLAPWCGDLPQIPDQRPLRCDATGWYTPQTVGNTCRNNAHSPKRTDGIHQFSMQWKVSWLVLHQMAVIKEKCRITCGEPQSKKNKRLTATAFGAELTWLCNIFTYLVPLFTSRRLSRLQRQVHGRSCDPASLPTQDFRHGRLGLEQVKQ